jgi:hypothetical protein
MTRRTARTAWVHALAAGLCNPAQAGRAAMAGARACGSLSGPLWKPSASYFFLAPARLAARKEIPARMAFC